MPEASRRHGLARLYDQPYLLLAFTQLLWAGNFVLGRAVRDAVPPIALAFWRWGGAFLIILAFAWPHLRRDWPGLLNQWRIVLLLALTGVAAFNTLVYIGLQSTTAINALLLQSMMPLLIIACSFLVFGDRIGWRQGLGLAVSFCGVAAIITRGDFGALMRLDLNRGDVWVFAAVVAYAVYVALLRRRPQVHPMSFLAASFATGALMLLPLLAWEHVGGNPLRLTPISGAAIAYVAVLPSVVAFFCWNRGVELVGANKAGQFIHLMPVFGSVLATLLLGEPFRWFHGLGGVLIFAGIVLATRR